MEIIDTCFSIYDYVTEKELDEYGVAPHVIRALLKARTLLCSSLQVMSPNTPGTTINLLNIAHQCIIWLHNLSIVKAS